MAILAVAFLFAAMPGGIAFGEGARNSSDAGADQEPPQSQTDVGTDSESPEAVIDRTANSVTRAGPGSTTETRIFPTPINYRAPDGEWEPIGEEFHETATGQLVNGPNSFDVTLPGELDTGAVRLTTKDGSWVSSRLLRQAVDSFDATQLTATYEADDEIAFEFSNLSNGLKEQIEIPEPGTVDSRYSYQLQASADLDPSLDPDGAIRFEDRSGNAIVTLPPPTMTDSAEVPATSRAIHYELWKDAGEGGWRLDVIPNTDWIDDPTRVYPVNLDPSFVVESLGRNCVISGKTGQEGWIDCASSGRQDLVAGYEPQPNAAEDIWYRTLMNLPMAGVPKSATIAAAYLNLYAIEPARGTGEVKLMNVTKPWNSEANWRRYDGSHLWATEGGDYEAPVGGHNTSLEGNAAGWWSFQLFGNYVESKFKGGEDLSLMLKLLEDKNRQCSGSPLKCERRYARFASSAISISAFRPYLKVLYNLPKAPLSSKLTAPQEGAVTAKYLPVKADWGAKGITGLTYEFRDAKNSENFQKVPPSAIRDVAGSAVVSSWPMSVPSTATGSNLMYLDAPGLSSQLGNEGGRIQLRALLEGTGGAAGITEPVDAIVDHETGGSGDATKDVGPGTVDLVTGNFTTVHTDVSMATFNSGLSFTRTYNSRGLRTALARAKTQADKTRIEEEQKTNVLGAGWIPGIPVEEAGGSEWRGIRIISESEEIEGELYSFEYAMVTDQSGVELPFPKEGTTFTPFREGAQSYALSYEGSNLVLADLEGNRTVFAPIGPGGEYLPVTVQTLGGNANQTQIIWEYVAGKRRIKMAVAPSAAGVNCVGENAARENPGCKSLEFSYNAATVYNAPAAYGQRLAGIKFFAPGIAAPVDVAAYSYDPEGRLVSEWDPRITPPLVESYSYYKPAFPGSPAAQLKTITPAGRQPWTLEYSPITFDSRSGRLLSVKRPSLIPATPVSQTSIVYDVPVSGPGAPYGLGVSAISQWGQEDVPFSATAVFPPNQVPTASPPASYSSATVSYMDPEGHLVNTASPAGAGTSAESISTTETDAFGNVTRSLTAQNRLRALAAGSNSVARSRELESKRLYSADGGRLVQEWGPLHAVRLEAGSTVQARRHKVMEYEEVSSRPYSKMPPVFILTREIEGASIPGQSTDADTKVTETNFNGALLKPLETVIDPGGLNIRRRTIYDGYTGLMTEFRQPRDSTKTLEEEVAEGPPYPKPGGAASTRLFYYTTKTPARAAEDGEPTDCAGNPAYAGLLCRVGPVVQPASPAKPLLVTKYVSYNAYGSVTKKLESPGSLSPRETVATYDLAGRNVTSVTLNGNGTPLPKVEQRYDPNTGLPTQRKFVCTTSCETYDDQAVTTTYDSLGRVTEYVDAEGTKSLRSYDLLGRLSVTTDGKGSQTRTYDANTGLLVQLQDSAVGLFTAKYDADGNMVSRTLPNGLTASTTFDEAGQPIHLSYAKATSCGVTCTWFDEEVKRTVSGQIATQVDTTDSRSYSYDKAGRLTVARITPTGGSCTTRKYGYDLDSNRTSLTTVAPGIGGACTEAGGVQKLFQYDEADRLKAGGQYDNMGRHEFVSAAATGGEFLETKFYSGDAVKSQRQGAVTNSYLLDASLRQRQRVQAGGLEGIEVSHYADESDAVTWSERGSEWTRMIVGINGEMSGLQSSSTGVTLELTNLHGDVVASTSPSSSSTSYTFRPLTDEFGVPTASGGQYSWLGGKARQTELPSGVVQMGVRSYVPQIGRFISPDPVRGGSASAYDYANADPVNGFDLNGTKPYDIDNEGPCSGQLHIYSPSMKKGRNSYGKLYGRWRIHCGASFYQVNIQKITMLVQQKSNGRKIGGFEKRVSSPTRLDRNTFGTWNDPRAPSFSCLDDIEYEWSIVINFTYVSLPGITPASPLSDSGSGTMSLNAQEFCNHGKY